MIFCKANLSKLKFSIFLRKTKFYKYKKRQKTTMFVDFGLCPRSRCRCAVIYIKLVRPALMLLSLLLRLPFSPSSSNVPRDLRHLFTLSWPQIGAKWYSNKEGILRRIKTCYKPKKHRSWLQQTSLVESSIDHLRPLRDFGGISSLTTHLFLITQRQLRVPNKIRTEKRKQLFWATSSLTCDPSIFCATGRVIAFPLSSFIFPDRIKKVSLSHSLYGTWSISSSATANHAMRTITLRDQKKEPGKTPTRDKT